MPELRYCKKHGWLPLRAFNIRKNKRASRKTLSLIYACKKCRRIYDSGRRDEYNKARRDKYWADKATREGAPCLQD